MSCIVEIRLHLQGHFQCDPKVTYVDGWYFTIRDVDSNALSFDNLKAIHSAAGGGEDPMRFFFGSKSCGIDGGVSEIKNDDDVKLWVYLYEGAPFLELYAAKEVPPEWVSSTGQVLGGDVFDEQAGGLDQLREEGECYELDEVEEGECDELDEVEELVAIEKRRVDDDVLFDGEGRLETENNIWEELHDIAHLTVSQEHIVGQTEPRGNEQELGFSNIQPNINEFEECVNEEDLLDSEDRLYPHFNVELEFKKPKFALAVGQTFSSPQQFRTVLREWNIRNGFTVKYLKNESSRITAVCEQGCSWRIHASPVQGEKTFRIKTLKGVHTCGRQYKNKHCNSTYLGEKYFEKIKDNPDMSVLAFQKDVKRQLNVQVSLIQAYRAKRKAMEMAAGDECTQYKRLWDYCETIRKFNPGSTIRIKLEDLHIQEDRVGDVVNVTEGRVFQRMYYCLEATKRGFLTGCRPVIGLDGCFLKGNYGGQLLSAIGRDGNDNMYPIAFCVAEAETYESWRWFLDHLSDDLGGSLGRQWTIISDRQKGLVKAVSEVFPDAEHRYCIRHMYENFKKKFRGKLLHDLFWRAASATNVAEYRKAMEMMGKAVPPIDGSETAVGWLEKVSKEMWCRAYFSLSSKCDILVNNLNESFNSCILPARSMSLVCMMDCIRKMLMRMISEKRSWIEGFNGTICPRAHTKIEKMKELSGHCFPHSSDGKKFEVECRGRDFVVDLEMKTCTCRSFELTGLPCQHAIAAINLNRGNIEDYVDSCYKKEAYIMAYSYSVYPVPSMEYWEVTGLGAINPPFVKKQPGRPKKLRRRDADEGRSGSTSTRKGLTVRCKKCKQLGHNKRTCKNGPLVSSVPVISDDSNVQLSDQIFNVDPSVPIMSTAQIARKKQAVRRMAATQIHQSQPSAVVATQGSITSSQQIIESQTSGMALSRRSPRKAINKEGCTSRRLNASGTVTSYGSDAL